MLIRPEPDLLEEEIQLRERHKMAAFPTLTLSQLKCVDTPMPCRTGDFFRGLSIQARRDFELLATRVQCLPTKVLIAEEQKPSNILFLLEGEVNVLMTSLNGKQFLLGVVGTGEILGLASAISGDSSKITAVARHACKMASLHRQDFLDFLMRHPSASQSIALELSRLYGRVCARLRILGLATTVPARLANLMLEWAREGLQTESGTQIRFVLTHDEIAACIGASRESVTRALTDFKNRDLVRVHGSTLIVPSRTALAIYAGIDSIPDRQASAQ